MKAFYTDFDKMRDEKYDGMIITGAPVEQMDFEEVTYWDEITGDIRLGAYACHVHPLYLLGGASRTLPSLRSAQIPVGRKDVRYIRASYAATSLSHFPWF